MSDAFARPIAAVPTATPALAKLSITAIILTGNEERHIERCLSRILSFVERVVVVDSFSSDATVAIATRMGAEVVCHAFKHQAAQMQWALDTLTITTAWVLKLDCDEYFESSALQDLADRLSDLPGDVTGLQFSPQSTSSHGQVDSDSVVIISDLSLLRIWRIRRGADGAAVDG